MEYGLFNPDTKAVTPIFSLREAALAHQEVRNLRTTHVGSYWVSSVFLFLNHGFWRREDLWFETMVFHLETGMAEKACRRASNFDECMAHHICFVGELRLGWNPAQEEVSNG